MACLKVHDTCRSVRQRAVGPCIEVLSSLGTGGGAHAWLVPGAWQGLRGAQPAAPGPTAAGQVRSKTRKVIGRRQYLERENRMEKKRRAAVLESQNTKLWKYSHLVR